MGGNITIRIDYATDVEFYEDLDMEDAMKSKERGNCLFEKELYHEAILAYTRGIELCPPVSLLSTLLCNRAFCFMNIQNYEAAIQGTIYIFHDNLRNLTLESSNTNFERLQKSYC